MIEKENKYYALKKFNFILTEEQKDKYNNILKILLKINNENIIKYYYSFEEKGVFNILMEYGGDKNLKQSLKIIKIIINILKKKIIIQICIWLKEIHKNNLIHRDLTPENIFIDKKIKLRLEILAFQKL